MVHCTLYRASQCRARSAVSTRIIVDNTSKSLPILVLMVMSTAALAGEAGMLRCRGLTDPTARLACYDALAPIAKSAEQFGRETTVAAASPVLRSIQSHIPGIFEGWQPNTRIRLANGQLWQIVDGTSGSYRLVDAKVTVKRGALGSFFLELDTEKRSLRVKRIE